MSRREELLERFRAAQTTEERQRIMHELLPIGRRRLALMAALVVLELILIPIYGRDGMFLSLGLMFVVAGILHFTVGL